MHNDYTLIAKLSVKGFIVAERLRRWTGIPVRFPHIGLSPANNDWLYVASAGLLNVDLYKQQSFLFLAFSVVFFFYQENSDLHR